MSVEYPKNELTRVLEETSRLNAGGRAAGVASATPMPTVQSADVGRMVPELPSLTPEERAELDRKAVEAGIKDERITIPEDSPYNTLEAALAAGAPVRMPSMQAIPAPSLGRQTAREFLARESRLPDFFKIEGIDLISNVVWVDGMSFPITPVEAADFKVFVVNKARNSIMEKLTEAMNLFVLPETAEDAPNGGAPGAET